MKMFKKNSKKGFTLIELLVVIAIIGILSSVVLASLNSARKKSRDARRVADIGQIKLALELAFDKNSTYPGGAYTAAMAALKADSLIPQEPKDPLDTGLYVYTYCPIGVPGSVSDYHLTAILEENNTKGPLASDTDWAAQPCAAGSGIDVSGVDSSTNYAYDVRP